MQNKFLFIISLLLFYSSLDVKAQYSEEELESNRCFIGSTGFMLFNLSSNERPDFYQINLGYRLSEKDVISLEIKTWRYFEPLGIPYGKSKTDPAENFPGYIRERGFAIAYQRFLWKGLYTAIHSMAAWQSFVNEEGRKFDDGFQIFNTYRLGYHIKLFNGKFFIEPSLAVTHRPYHTTMPEDFGQLDDKWSKLFFGEPGLHIGYNF